MKISDRWENVTLLVCAIALLPIWMAQSKQVPMPGGISSLLQVLHVCLARGACYHSDTARSEGGGGVPRKQESVRLSEIN